MYEWPILLGVLGLVAVASAVQAHAGFGFALLVVPLTTAMIGPKETVLLVTLLALAMNAVQSIRLRQFVQRGAAGGMIAGSFAGMPVGLAVLLAVEPAVLKAGAAIAVLVATALLARGLTIPSNGTKSDITAGIVSGVLNTSTGINGPPIAIYLHNRMAPPQFRGTIAVFFLFSAVGAVILLTTASAVDGRSVRTAFVGVPVIFVASAYGNILFARTNAEQFRRVTLAILVLSGCTAFGLAVADLLG